MRFFLDRNLGKRFGEILMQAGISVVLHNDLFEQNVTDQEWIRTIGKHSFVAVTRDQRIGRNYLEQKAVARAGLKMVVIVGGNARSDELADNFIRTLSTLQRFINNHQAPFIAKLRRPSTKDRQSGKAGKVEMYRSREALSSLR